MLHSIHNGCLEAAISTCGAQLMSLQGAGGTQYLWQGDPKYWTDRAPNIFPYVARLTGGCYTYRGKTYRLPIHGFAPTAEFMVTEKEESSITFTLETCPAFYEQYPFRFRYCIRYRLQEDTLHVQLRAENLDSKTMYFGLGGHPGINVPLEEGLSFEDYFLEFPPASPAGWNLPRIASSPAGSCPSPWKTGNTRSITTCLTRTPSFSKAFPGR